MMPPRDDDGDKQLDEAAPATELPSEPTQPNAEPPHVHAVDEEATVNPVDDEAHVNPIDESAPVDDFNPATDPGITDSIAVNEPAVEEPLPAVAMTGERLASLVESLLFAADRPLAPADFVELIADVDAATIEGALHFLQASFADRGVQLAAVGGGWQFRTDPRNGPWVARLLQAKPVRLTRAQLETLAIVAYRQPITRPEIDEIRGVDSGGTLKTLLERGLLRILGKKEEPGRPMLYGTTREFLEFFHLRDLKDLPTLREFHELSGEHAAQVEALVGVAPAGTVETAATDPAAPLPLARVELSDDTLLADLSDVDERISRAAEKAAVAMKRLEAETTAPVAAPPQDAPDHATPTRKDGTPE